MITATHTPTDTPVEIITRNDYLPYPRYTVRTLDGSEPFLRATNQDGARFYTGIADVLKRTLTDIRHNGLTAKEAEQFNNALTRFDKALIMEENAQIIFHTTRSISRRDQAELDRQTYHAAAIALSRQVVKHLPA